MTLDDVLHRASSAGSKHNAKSLKWHLGHVLLRYGPGLGCKGVVIDGNEYSCVLDRRGQLLQNGDCRITAFRTKFCCITNTFASMLN